MFPASRWFVLFSMLVSVSWTSRAAAGEVECDPAALEQAMAGCGIDVACINQVMADYNAACMAQAGTEGGGTGGTGGAGMGGMADAMARIQACGGDPACQQEVMEELQQQYEEGASMTDEEFETTSRLHERTVLPSSWLQSYQEALVSCEKNVGCWTGLMAGALAFTDSVCGPLSPSEAVALCHVAARYEIHIEQAIAQQRLWRKGIRFEGDAPGAEPLGEPSPGGSPTPGSGTKVPDASKKSFTFLPKVKESNVRKLLDTWERKLEKELAAEARQKIDAGAAQFPVDSEAGTPPLVYEEKETPEGLEMDAHPTRRDWYYALTGVLLTHAGLVEGGEKGEVLLDAALWSLIQAAQMKPEVEHFSNIGFHLNLRGELDAARTVLTHARTLDGNHPDVYNNLAFGYSAEGKAEEALALQENAARLAPDNAHIRSRLESMAGAAGKEPMPYGGDFGEAFFRFGKRHTLREVEAGRRWFKARELAKHRNFGGTPVVPGPHEWYAEQIRDIEDAHSACIGNAPEVAKGCPFGAGIIHPSCKNAASPEEVARTQHNRNVHMCQCDANALMAKADALSAYLDRAIAVWREHEKLWWPRLRQYVAAWEPEIRQLNDRYKGTNFEFPVESAYSFWPGEFKEDSEEAWGTDIPDIAAKWYDLKTRAQNLKSCGTKLPPPPKKPKKPKPEKPPKVKSYGINLFVVSFELSMDGSFKFGFDLGVVKGGYERIPGVDGHKFTLGSGPVELSYQTNGAPAPGGDSSNVSMTVGTNFFKWIPGAGRVAGDIADQFYSFGSKYEVGWGNKTGITGKATVESKSKFGFTSRDVALAPATSMLN